MYETKPGNGGHGLEVYDTETGKYAEVTCHFGNLEVHNWEDLRDALLAQNPNYKSVYETNKQIAQQFDEMVQDKMYPELLQQEVDVQNEQMQSQMSFKDPADAAQNFHKLFSKRMVDNLVANNFAYYDQISVNPYKPDYKVGTLAACIQMNRYKGNNRMKPITKQEYENRMKNSNGHKDFSSNWSSCDELFAYVKNSPEILVNRTMGIRDEGIWQKVKQSFYDENSNINSTLSRVGGKNCSYYGSVCYMSAGIGEYDSWSSAHKITGIIKNEGLKVLYSDIGNARSNERTCNNTIPEVNGFRAYILNNQNEVVENLKNQFKNNGVNNDMTARMMSMKVINEIKRDPGVCAMLMGYDAICGTSYQFDILNPNIVSIVVD